jgi:putative ABC transport system ATP-binding protein
VVASVEVGSRGPAAQVAAEPSSGTTELPSTAVLQEIRRPIIELTDVWKSYRAGSLSVDALRGVSLTIEEGDMVAISGPSGSGKSTLMHLIGCLDVPTSGTYLLDGLDVSTMSEDQLARVRNRTIGFVFQQFNLLADLNALKNVELPLAYGGVPKSQRRDRALRSLEIVGLAGRVAHRPGELSGGQQQRVAIARALVTEPKLILADEPTGNLDSASAGEILGLLEDLNAQGRTVVVITHDAYVASRAKRVVRILDGLVQPDGDAPPSYAAEPSTGLAP